MEIQSTQQLDAWLDTGQPVGGLRLQDIDLTPVAARLRGMEDLAGLVVLGGTAPPGLVTHLQAHGAVVFPSVPDVPVEVYRAHLYTGHELYAGMEGPGGYAATVDSRAYDWARDMRLADDAYATLLKAIHDDSISDALAEWVVGRRVVGVMGGHAQERGSRGYAAAARLGRALAERGLLVATGGGPGAMEAANLGAATPSADALETALEQLEAVPSFRPGVEEWARAAFAALATLGPRVQPHPGTPSPAADPGAPSDRPRSLGVPTWFYGHEPPNVFAEGIAKYFSNAIREDGLLALCNAGVVVLPGAAGTVQEVFQLCTRLYYAAPGASLPPLVLVGREQWTEVVPVWPLVRALGAGRPMGGAVHLVDDAREAVGIVGA